MVRFPTTDTCVRCHYGDASIGLSFRGLAQPVPGMPQSPDAPGLHPKRLNGVYYIDDPASTPADVHHQRGMHCVDCHMREDAMGDGFLYRRMEDAVGVRCQTCHGSQDRYATGVDQRDKKFPHLVLQGPDVFLKSRVTGKLHRAKLAEAKIPKHVKAPDYAKRLPKEIRQFTTKGVYDLGKKTHLSFTQGAGHGGSHPHLAHEFITALVDDRDPWPNARQSANWTCVGLCAHDSAMQGGKIIKLPAFTQ
jgi:hypothetical protein